MTYKNSAPPGAQVVSHNRTQSDVLLASFRQPNETEEKIPLSKKVLKIIEAFNIFCESPLCYRFFVSWISTDYVGMGKS